MFDLQTLLRVGGYSGLFAIVFAESGLLIGLFLPGDSLLFTAGFLASQGVFHIGLLLPLAIVAAVLGDSTGYWFGHMVGPAIFKREDSLLFHKHNLRRAEQFYQKHGGQAIVLARFMPIVRTFAPILAGVGSMQYGSFLMYNILGGTLWGGGLTLAGFLLGNSIPNPDRYLLPVIALIIILSVLPPAWHLFHKRLRDYLARGI